MAQLKIRTCLLSHNKHDVTLAFKLKVKVKLDKEHTPLNLLKIEPLSVNHIYIIQFICC